MIDVLVLDDDVYVGRLHCRYVEQTPGFRALEPVRDLRSARKVLAAGGVDLLLADEVLPDGTGTQLIRETSVDAALLTAVTDAQVVRAALSPSRVPSDLTTLLGRPTADGIASAWAAGPPPSASPPPRPTSAWRHRGWSG